MTAARWLMSTLLTHKSDGAAFQVTEHDHANADKLHFQYLFLQNFRAWWKTPGPQCNLIKKIFFAFAQRSDAKKLQKVLN